jgi:hypothetical protein
VKERVALREDVQAPLKEPGGKGQLELQVLGLEPRVHRKVEGGLALGARELHPSPVPERPKAKGGGFPGLGLGRERGWDAGLEAAGLNLQAGG